jgi:ATP-dependent Clp protease adaptor protein ClpS
MANIPATKPETGIGQSLMLLPRYRVLLHNDDVNSMEHVMKVLARVFRFDRSRCEQVMLEAHKNGVALCTTEPFEQAEYHRDQLISFSLISTIEPE